MSVRPTRYNLAALEEALQVWLNAVLSAGDEKGEGAPQLAQLRVEVRQ